MTLAPETISLLETHLKYHRGAWLGVTNAGRAYAQMKTFGTYEENGLVIRVCESERQQMIQHFQTALLFEVERAYAEDARLGAAIGDAGGVST